MTKVRIDEPLLNVETIGPASFTRRQIQEMLDKLTGLKELRFEHEIPHPGELSRLCGTRLTQLEKNGLVVISRS